MGEDERNEAEAQGANGEQEDPEHPGNPEGEDNRPDDGTLSDDKKCPECGAPVENLRATCPNCGHEYSEDEYDDPEAGQEFLAGSEIDEEGNEMTTEDSGDAEKDGASEGSSSDDS